MDPVAMFPTGLVGSVGGFAETSGPSCDESAVESRADSVGPGLSWLLRGDPGEPTRLPYPCQAMPVSVGMVFRATDGVLAVADGRLTGPELVAGRQ